MFQSQSSDAAAPSEPPPPYQPPKSVPEKLLAEKGGREESESNLRHVYRSKSGHYNVLHDDETPAFYVKNHSVRVPELVIHRGDGRHDQEVANCEFPKYSDLYAINLLEEVNVQRYIKLTKMTLDGCFTAKTLVPDGTGAITSTVRPFVWRGTTELMLLDRETSQAVAVMHGVTHGSAKCFELEMLEQYGEQFELLVLASAMVMYESQRREHASPS